MKGCARASAELIRRLGSLTSSRCMKSMPIGDTCLRKQEANVNNNFDETCDDCMWMLYLNRRSGYSASLVSVLLWISSGVLPENKWEVVLHINRWIMPYQRKEESQTITCSKSLRETTSRTGNRSLQRELQELQPYVTHDGRLYMSLCMYSFHSSNQCSSTSPLFVSCAPSSQSACSVRSR